MLPPIWRHVGWLFRLSLPDKSHHFLAVWEDLSVFLGFGGSYISSEEPEEGGSFLGALLEELNE